MKASRKRQDVINEQGVVMLKRLKRAAIPLGVLGAGIGAVVLLTLTKPTPILPVSPRER